MLTSNADLMTAARIALKGKMSLPMGAFVVFVLISAVAGCIPFAGSLLITGPLTMGFYLLFLNFVRGRESRFNQLFDGFNSFTAALVAYVVSVVFIILWTLLLIVPGIIAAISYSQTFFIIADDKTITGMDAIRKSKEMMKGNKGKFFGLCCRFIGWFLLGIITLGIGFLWIGPYFVASQAKFYDDLKAVKPAM